MFVCLYALGIKSVTLNATQLKYVKTSCIITVRTLQKYQGPERQQSEELLQINVVLREFTDILNSIKNIILFCVITTSKYLKITSK